MVIKKILSGLLIFSLATGLSFGYSGNDENEHAHSSEKEKDQGFDPGTFIMDHVSDSYEWHIITVGETHVSIPLPIILYSKA